MHNSDSHLLLTGGPNHQHNFVDCSHLLILIYRTVNPTVSSVNCRYVAVNYYSQFGVSQ